MTLSGKRKRFVEEYCGPSRLNATQATIAAGYSERSASAIGYENLRKPQIRDAIAERLEQYSMSAAEATERMADMARGTLSTKVITKEGKSVEEFDTKDATKEILKLHGAYAQPDGGDVKFLIVRDLSEVEVE